MDERGHFNFHIYLFIIIFFLDSIFYLFIICIRLHWKQSRLQKIQSPVHSTFHFQFKIFTIDKFDIRTF